MITITTGIPIDGGGSNEEFILMPENVLVTAKDISKKYKVPYPTINHYTDLGFLPIVKKEGSRRMYNNKQVRDRLQLISKMINEGYPLRLIRKKITMEGRGGS